MDSRGIVATIISLFSLLCFVEITVADTGELVVHVSDNGQPVSDAVVTATCIDTGCDAMYTFDIMGEGDYRHPALQAPHNYRILAEKGTKSATSTRFVEPGINLPDVNLTLVDVPQDPWEAATAQASTVHGSEAAERSCVLNHMIFMLIPAVAVVALRIWRRKW